MESERATNVGLVRNQLADKENIPCTKDGSDISSKSKIPILVKARPMPDFNTLHQSFENKFQKGKAVRKRACTRPCPFNLTKKGEQFQLQPIIDVGHQPLPMSDIPLNPSKNSCLRGPLLENQQDAKCGATAQGFKADPAALASILSNSGLSSKAMGISRATSLVQRAPVRGNRNDRASAYVSCGSSVSRMESFCPSCTSRRTDKALEDRPQQSQDPKPALPSRPLLSLLPGMNSAAQPLTDPQVHSTGTVPGTGELCRAGQEGTGESSTGMAGGEGHSSEDGKPVIQAAPTPTTCPMIPKDVSLLDSVASAPVTCPLDPNSLTCSGTVAPSICSVAPRNLACPAVATLAPDGGLSKADSKDFVPDLEALASILSNTGLTSSTVATSKKTSMVQRVPVRDRGMTSLYSTASSSSMANRGSLFGQRMSFDPKMSSSRMYMSRLESKEKEMCGTPFWVPKPSTKLLPLCSAQRVAIQHPLYPQLHKTPRRRPVFPKTLQDKAMVETQQTPSQMCRQWTNVESPQSLDSCRGAEDDDGVGLPMEKIAVQLFPDVGDAAGDLGQVVASPSVDVGQETNKLKRIEHLARLLLQEMEGIKQLEFGASRDLGASMPADKIPHSRNSPASSQTSLKQKDAVVDNKQCPAPFRLDQSTVEAGHGTLPCTTQVPTGGLAAGLWDTGGSSTDHSGSSCCPVPAVASDTSLGVDKTHVYSSKRPLCSQPLGPSLDPGPVPQALTAISKDRVVPVPRVPTSSHVEKQRLYWLATSSQRFMDSCLDDECGFYTSRIAKQSHNRSDARARCLNPVAQTLAWQEALCFIPITHGEA